MKIIKNLSARTQVGLLALDIPRRRQSRHTQRGHPLQISQPERKFQQAVKNFNRRCSRHSFLYHGFELWLIPTGSVVAALGDSRFADNFVLSAEARTPAELQSRRIQKNFGAGDSQASHLEVVKDGHLHRFVYRASTGEMVRYIVILKGGSAYGVGLDACEICGGSNPHAKIFQ